MVSSVEPKKSPAVVEGAGESVEIVSSGEKRRKRQKKLVSKSFVDEDGFMGICLCHSFGACSFLLSHIA